MGLTIKKLNNETGLVILLFVATTGACKIQGS